VLYASVPQGQLERLQLLLVLADTLGQEEIFRNHFAIHIAASVY